MIKKGSYFISDPGFGLIEYNQKDFIKFWIGNSIKETTEEGIALLFEATPKFLQSEFDKEDKKGLGFGLLFQYVLLYKSFLIQLRSGLLTSSLLQLVFPFLMQSIVDVRIQNQTFILSI